MKMLTKIFYFYFYRSILLMIIMCLSSRGLRFPLPSMFNQKVYSSAFIDTEYCGHNNDIVEGLAKIKSTSDSKIFYNPAQIFNRDVSIQVVSLFNEILSFERRKEGNRFERFSACDDSSSHPLNFTGINILEALAATGLRSIRYAKEITGVNGLTLIDKCPNAINGSITNFMYNGINISNIKFHCGDCNDYMLNHINQYDVIDIDPYGSASPFLYSSIKSIKSGGLICATCTDMPTLVGNQYRACVSKYSSLPSNGTYHHEMALRILLHKIDLIAGECYRYIVPWLSISVDFYIRVFFRVYDNVIDGDDINNRDRLLDRIIVKQWTHTPTFEVLPVKYNHNDTIFRYEANGIRLDMSKFLRHNEANDMDDCVMTGPFYSKQLHDKSIVSLLKSRVERYQYEMASTDRFNSTSDGTPLIPIPTIKRMIGLLTAISEELHDVILYYSVPEMAKAIRSPKPKFLDIQSALYNSGYKASKFHHDRESIKTDAPSELLWDIMRAHRLKQSSYSKQSVDNLTSSLREGIASSINFTVPQSLIKTKSKISRFPWNPQVDWGPKRRAGRLEVKSE